MKKRAFWKRMKAARAATPASAMGWAASAAWMRSGAKTARAASRSCQEGIAAKEGEAARRRGKPPARPGASSGLGPGVCALTGQSLAAAGGEARRASAWAAASCWMRARGPSKRCVLGEGGGAPAGEGEANEPDRLAGRSPARPGDPGDPPPLWRPRSAPRPQGPWRAPSLARPPPSAASRAGARPKSRILASLL